MTRYEAAPWLRDLTRFQLASVEHVIEQFYGPAKAGRFLVADETGLGKTRVAQGVIARAIGLLQDCDPELRVDIVYVCANGDLAKQNIRRLNVTGRGEIPFSSRLTLLGEHSRRLNREESDGGGINLVSFTPGTSFDMGHSLGQARERAMIAIALMELYDLNGYQRTATKRLLQGGVRELATFQAQIDWLHRDLGEGGIDPAILTKYATRLEADGDRGLGSRYTALLDAMGRRHSIPLELRSDTNSLVRDLRSALAAASVHTLEPDLVILDEFQRFRHLLSEDNPAGELAHHLFQYDAAKVLLLSATPYKPFTFANETGEDHAKDLIRTLDFLARGRDDVSVDDITTGLADYRDALLDGDTDSRLPDLLRSHLMKLMSRAERPSLSTGSMADERVANASDIRAADLADFATVTKVAAHVGQPRDRALVTPEYWKSAPYFLTFSDGYQLGRRIRGAAPTTQLTRELAKTAHVSGAALERFEPLEPGNARMRLLTAATLDQGWGELLWLPPSLSYVEPAGPFATDSARTMTKRLVFSSWTATPSAVASILSYEAERRAAEGSEHYTAYTPAARTKIARRLQYTAAADGRPKQMAALLCLWPLPGLARKIDPAAWVAENGGRQLDREEALTHAIEVVSAHAGSRATPSGEGRQTGPHELRDAPWQVAFSWTDSWPDATDGQLAATLSGHRPDDVTETGQGDPDDIPDGLTFHLRAARGARAGASPVLDEAGTRVLAEIALYSPGNIAYRSLSRLIRDGAGVSAWGLFEAAAIVANGLRSLFNRHDAIQLVERIGAGGLPYWRKMLHYISMGNLEAVLDEYLYQLFADRASGEATDRLLVEVATEAAEALSLRSPTLRALDADDLSGNLAFTARFAQRYGGRQQDAEDARQPEVRRAFNSPFWPFVLASTSVGQEGIDFHWWCHAVFHWNTPSNPVDFEQREGRVDRYRGHAIRKNVAAAHGRAALSELGGHPWERLYELATDHQAELGDFSPGWVYPGPHCIERHVAPFVFSKDVERYDRLKQDVALYRLTFGQPRQEDLLDVLRRRGVDADPATLRSLRINLAP